MVVIIHVSVVHIFYYANKTRIIRGFSTFQKCFCRFAVPFFDKIVFEKVTALLCIGVVYSVGRDARKGTFHSVGRDVSKGAFYSVGRGTRG